MKFDTTRNKLYNAYRLQEENRKKTTRKPTTVVANENLPVTVKENIIYDSGWLKTVDGGTIVDNGLKVEMVDGQEEIVADSTTAETYIEVGHSKTSNFAVKNSLGYNTVNIEVNKAFDIPEEQLPFVDYAIVVKPIKDTTIKNEIQYISKVFDSKSLIKITGDGSLICYLYLSSSTIPDELDGAYYDKGYLNTSKVSKWYDCIFSTTNVADGRRFVYTGSLYGIFAQWNWVKRPDPLAIGGYVFTWDEFTGDGVLSISGNVVTAKGRYTSYKYDAINHTSYVATDIDTTKSINMVMDNADIWFKMSGYRVIDGGSPTTIYPAQIYKLTETNHTDYYYPTNRWTGSSVDSSEFNGKYRIWYSTKMKKQVELDTYPNNWDLTNLPKTTDYQSATLPYGSLKLELNPGINPQKIDAFFTGYPYSENANVQLIRLTHEKDSLGRYKYQLNTQKTFMYSTQATVESSTNRQTVDESYSVDGDTYSKNGDNRPFKELIEYETVLQELEFKVVVFLTPQPKYNRENKHK